MAKRERKIAQPKEEPTAPPTDALAAPSEGPPSVAGLIAPEKLKERVEQLRALETITNDKGEEVSFDGEAKEIFVEAFEAGYPVIASTLDSLYSLGRFLHDVRTKLKPHKLYYKWLEYAGIPQGTAQSYVQAYNRFGEELPRFAPLGIKKLLIASRLPNCVEYVEQHEDDIAALSADELAKQIKQIRQKGRKKGKGGRKPTYEEIGKVRIRPALDGSRLTVEGLTKAQQKEILEAIKALLSQGKE
jgi:hypothetical protein